MYIFGCFSSYIINISLYILIVFALRVCMRNQLQRVKDMEKQEEDRA